MFYKYPRTPHLPWSPGATKDDRMLADTSCFDGKRVIVSLKMDGENTTMYHDHVHARSLDSRDHISRHLVKSLWAQKGYLIPEGWRVCGENLYAKHSIHYTDLATYFMVFSIWNHKNMCLPYYATKELCESFGLAHVPVIDIGMWHDGMENYLAERFSEYSGQEGYVVRNYTGFGYEYFDTNVAKYVREAHVQTDKHWMHQQITVNKLRT